MLNDQARIDLLESNEVFALMGQEERILLAREAIEQNFSSGATLIRQGERSEHVFLVVSGRLAKIHDSEEGRTERLEQILPGQSLGELQVLFGGASHTSVIAEVDAMVLGFPARTIRELLAASPVAYQHIARQVRHRIQKRRMHAIFTKLLRTGNPEVHEALVSRSDWIHLRRGEVLFRQGDPDDSWYVIISGRMSVVIQDQEGNERVVSEMGKGETLGEISLFGEGLRTATLYALRDTELVRFSREAFVQMQRTAPQVTSSIIHTLVRRIMHKDELLDGEDSVLILGLIPSGPNAFINDLGKQLAAALEKFGPTVRVTPEMLRTKLKLPRLDNLPEDHPAWSRFRTWMEEAENTYRYILLECSYPVSVWTRCAVSASDRCLLIVPGGAGPDAVEPHRILRAKETNCVGSVPWDLVLVHPPHTSLPTGTRRLLDAGEFRRHIHLRIGNSGDLGRLARIVAGRAVGLALSGGGARGFAHLGVIRALEERKIPIDMICGTSMGAILGAQYATGKSMEEIREQNLNMITTKPFKEYTIPIVSLVKTAKVEKLARWVFDDILIEDLWLDYFCISSNLTRAQMVTHNHGLVREATRASSSLPGILVPAIQDGQLLVDGGVTNNLPGDLLKERCGGPVIAVNLHLEWNMSILHDVMPTGWQVFWSKVLPWRSSIHVPTINDILMRTVMLASAKHTSEVKKQVDLWLEPPVEAFGMLELKSMDQIMEIGYQYTLKMLDELGSDLDF